MEFGWVDYHKLKPLQGNLKKLPDELYEKLKSFEKKECLFLSLFGEK